MCGKPFLLPCTPPIDLRVAPKEVGDGWAEVGTVTTLASVILPIRVFGQVYQSSLGLLLFFVVYFVNFF